MPPVYAFSPLIRATDPPPVMEARRWLDEIAPPPDRPLINVSQGAPDALPPAGLRRAMAAMLDDLPSHLYGPTLGLPALRAAVAARWSAVYGGAIGPDCVAITPGCNMAFCAAIAAIAGPGDGVILPVPWYFNHRMWLAMAGIETQPLPVGDGMIPDPQAAARLIGPRTRAIVLVTPNNPTGAEYPPETLAAFAALARRHGIALVLDETYRDFHAACGAPHGLFADPGWRDTLIHLYSFSKAYRLTGHRTGALIAAPALLAEVEKVLDTTAICAPQLGQRAALWGLENLGDWVAGERAEMLARREAVLAGLGALAGWRVLGAGGYFAWAAHPFDAPSDRVARALLAEQGVLALPGTMFAPPGDAAGAGAIRIAYANLDRAGIAAMCARLAALAPGPALATREPTA